MKREILLGLALATVANGADVTATWGDTPEIQRDKTIFKGLSSDYRCFAGMTFMERLEKIERREQLDYVLRDMPRILFLEAHPNASARDWNPGGSAKVALKDVRMIPFSFDDLIQGDSHSYRWTPIQERIAREVAVLGRPLSSINPAMPLAKQYEVAQFDVLAQIAMGRRLSSLTEREMSVFLAQMEYATRINKRSPNAYRTFQLRVQREEKEDAQKNLFSPKGPYKPKGVADEQFPCEWINGKKVFTKDSGAPNSIYMEVTRKVSEQLVADLPKIKEFYFWRQRALANLSAQNTH